MNLFKFLALSSMVFSLSCTPDPLEGFEADAGGGKTDTKVESDVTATDKGTGEASAEFKFVADQFRLSCGQITCHGSRAGNGLKAVQSANSTDKEVFDALTTETLSTDGDPFILAGNAAGSNYIIRMEREPTDGGFMPIGGTKDQTELDKIKAWINDGATFN